MPWEFDQDSYDPETLDAYDSPAVGGYHFEVSRVEENSVSSGKGSAQMEVDIDVLAGTVADQEGKSHREYFTKSEAAAKRALLFAVACGLTTVEELKACKEQGRNPVIDFSKAVGRQFKGRLEEEEYEGKKRVKLGFNMWPVDSPKAADIPVNKGKLAQLGDASDDPFGGAADDDVF